jgi:hypothetical protein
MEIVDKANFWREGADAIRDRNHYWLSIFRNSDWSRRCRERDCVVYVYWRGVNLARHFGPII